MSHVNATVATVNVIEIEAAELPGVEQPTAMERLILKHAMKSFGERGYAATTLRSIAAEARVTAPMVSYYFKSKERLFQYLAEIVMASLEFEVRRALDRATSFHEAILAIATVHVEIAARSPSSVRFLFSLLYGPSEGRPSPDVEAMYESTRIMMTEVFENGIRSGEFRPRAGMTVDFLAGQLGTLLHDHVSRSFRIAQKSQHEDRTRERDWPLELTLQQFFFGAGDVPALAKP